MGEQVTKILYNPTLQKIKNWENWVLVKFTEKYFWDLFWYILI